MTTDLRMTRPVVANPNNPEELLLDLGPEICAYLGWQAGDVVEWVDNKDGTWTIRKKHSPDSNSNP